MKAFKPILSVLLVLVLVFSIMPVSAAETSQEIGNARGVHSTVIIDDDPADGYEGDYVVIYNPSLSASNSISTGNLNGLIETTVEPNIVDFGKSQAQNYDLPIYKMDIDGVLNELAQSTEPGEKPEPKRETYTVGSKKTFVILENYSPTGSDTMEFECLYVGEHCYIWTPVSSSNNTYPLDEIDSTYAKMAADEFDSKFDLMQSSFGNHTNSSQGDGKLHMLYYNINDGWQPGQGYIAGFFYQVDITNNSLPILNIDTYPGVYYKSSSGTEYKRMDDTYNTMVHEYQHLINYSNTSGMSSWLNECFSAAAEEICYPGSSVVSRIQSYENYFYSSNWQNPPKEIEYDPSACPNLHKGYSMYAWDNNIDDILALYGQVSLFAQYLYSRYGNTIYKTISNKYSSSEVSAITSGTGMNCADLVKNFRVALTANTTANVLNGTYYFKTQDGYDPDEYYGVENPYNLLAPIIFTGSSCSIKGGGAITVKPVNGVYNPPSGASSSLKYIGVKFVRDSITSVTLDDVSVKCGGINTAKLTVLPEGTADYTVAYTSAAPGIFTVDANGVITGVAPGAGTLSAVVHDNTANRDYNVSCTVTVENFHGYVLTDTVEVGGKYIIIAGGAINGTSGYAVGNTTVSGYSYYLNPVAVTVIDGSAVAYDSSIDFDAISWIPSGNASTGYAWQNVGNSKYIGLNSDEIVCPSTTATKWLYGTDKYFNCNTGDYPYLSFAEAASSKPMRYTSSSAGAEILLFKYVEPVVNYTVTATVNNSAYGSVSVSGTVITATPANGYYVESCTLVSGNATWTISGNTINVSPSSDCTIRVNFAPKPSYTVNFVASGTAQGSQTAYLNDPITLPTSVSVDPDGWTFAGWVTAQFDETTDEPAYYAPGASYTVTGNATLYALFTRVDGGGSETVYQLVESAPTSWAGNYVITNNPTNITDLSSAYVLKGVTGSSNGTNAETASNCTAFSSTGIVLDNSALKNVPNDYIIVIDAQGSYYSVKSAATGCYYGMNSSSYLYAYSSYNSSYCAWTPAINTNGVAQLKNNRNGSYPYFSWSTSNSYFWSGSSNNANVLRLWKETVISSDVTYYCTDPSVAQPTEYTVTFKDWDGTVLKTETVAEGGSATAPADPARTGYTFTGWDVSFTNVTSDLIVTAQYQINNYTVTYYVNGVEIHQDTYNYGANVTAYSYTAPVGYTFSGWTETIPATMPAQNLEIHGTTTINTYTVTFVDWNDAVISTQNVEHGGAATAPAAPERTGYNFTGWDTDFSNVTSNLTVKAQYEAIRHTLTINYVYYQNGQAAAEAVTVSLGYEETYSYATPELANYTADTASVEGVMGLEDITVTVTYYSSLNGDVNCDGKVDFEDVTLLSAFTVGSCTLVSQGALNGDINGDGETTSVDISYLYNRLLNSSSN